MISRSWGLWGSLAVKQRNMFSSRSVHNPSKKASPSASSSELKSTSFSWPIKVLQIDPSRQPSQAEKSFLKDHWHGKSILSPRKPSARTVSESVYRVEDSSFGVASSVMSVLGYIPILGCLAAGISMLTHGPYSYLRSENTKLDQAIKKTDTLHFLSSIPVFITKTIQLSTPIEVAMTVSFQLFSVIGAIKSTLELIKNGRIIFNASSIKSEIQNSSIAPKDKEYLIQKLSKKQKIEGFKGVGNACLLVGSILMLIPFCQIPSLVLLILGSFIRCGIALKQYRKLSVKNQKIPVIKEELTVRHRMDIRDKKKSTNINEAIAITRKRLDKLNQGSFATRYESVSKRLTLRLKELKQLQIEGIQDVWGWHSDTQLKDGHTSQFDFYIQKNASGEEELISLQSSINPYQTQAKKVPTDLQKAEQSINKQLYQFLSTSKVIKKLKEDYQSQPDLVCLLEKADSLLR